MASIKLAKRRDIKKKHLMYRALSNAGFGNVYYEYKNGEPYDDRRLRGEELDTLNSITNELAESLGLIDSEEA